MPALVYSAVNAGGPGAGGWGIPMATDIAFAVGVLALLGPRVPPALKLFLLALAIVDDIGAIVVIAVFYSEGIELRWLAGRALGVRRASSALRRPASRHPLVYVVLGVALWLCRLRVRRARHDRRRRPRAADARRRLPRPRPVLDRLEHGLHPWTSFLIVPVVRARQRRRRARPDALTRGVAARHAGRRRRTRRRQDRRRRRRRPPSALRLGLGRLPDGVRSRQILGLAAVAGIGFTVSLFVAGLAFAGVALLTRRRSASWAPASWPPPSGSPRSVCAQGLNAEDHRHRDLAVRPTTWRRATHVPSSLPEVPGQAFEPPPAQAPPP